MNRLYIAVKAPRPGFVKTRLAQHVGVEAATRLYAAFLRDLAKRFPEARWFFTPDSAWPEVAAAGVLPLNAVATPQGPGSWGVRQDRLFASTAPTRSDPVVLIGSDSPQVGSSAIAEAFRELARKDLVLGPVHDGGYWLVGMSGHHDLLAGIPMSTPSVLSSLLGEARRRGLTVALLEPQFDVDELSDLAALERAVATGDLPHTGAALAELSAGFGQVWDR